MSEEQKKNEPKALSDFGRSTSDRVIYLLKNLTPEELKSYYRLESYTKIWFACSGGSADMNEHSGFFLETSKYCIRQIDAVFFVKFNIHIERLPFQLGMTEDSDEWIHGIKPQRH